MHIAVEGLPSAETAIGAASRVKDGWARLTVASATKLASLDPSHGVASFVCVLRRHCAFGWTLWAAACRPLAPDTRCALQQSMASPADIDEASLRRADAGYCGIGRDGLRIASSLNQPRTHTRAPLP